VPPLAPVSPRLRIRREQGRLLLESTGQRTLLGSIVLALWLVAWAFGESVAVRQLFFSDAAEGGSWFLALWLLLWTAGGLLALAVLLRGLAGRESIAVEGRTLSVRTGALGRTRRFDLSGIRDLRVEPAVPPGSPGLHAVFHDVEMLRPDPGRAAALAFEGSGASVRFGAGLDEGELEEARAALSDRIPGSRPAFE
jgi:hypothetical protein